MPKLKSQALAKKDKIKLLRHMLLAHLLHLGSVYKILFIIQSHNPCNFVRLFSFNVNLKNISSNWIVVRSFSIVATVNPGLKKTQ